MFCPDGTLSERAARGWVASAAPPLRDNAGDDQTVGAVPPSCVPWGFPRKSTQSTFPKPEPSKYKTPRMSALNLIPPLWFTHGSTLATPRDKWGWPRCRSAGERVVRRHAPLPGSR